MKKLLKILSAIIAAGSYAYMICAIIRGTGEGLLISTFALWSILAWITTVSMLGKVERSALIVPCIYATGATTTSIILVFKGRYGFSGLDGLTTSLATFCIVALIGNEKTKALVLSVAAGMIAAVPFIALTWQRPEHSPIIPNAGCLAANILGLMAIPNRKIESWLFYVANIMLGIALVLPWLLMFVW
ncbi:MAG TPA: hypothetical protein VGE35_03695 [Candidatus Paceibacterota bacterium]